MLELRNYEENQKAGSMAQSVMASRASAAGGGPVSAERPFPVGVEYESSTMGIIPVSHTFFSIYEQCSR